ncbi:MAG: hypothetical protein ACLFQV_06200 [Vulcanimicrobiota bacterium]
MTRKKLFLLAVMLIVSITTTSLFAETVKPGDDKRGPRIRINEIKRTNDGVMVEGIVKDYDSNIKDVLYAFVNVEKFEMVEPASFNHIDAVDGAYDSKIESFSINVKNEKQVGYLYIKALDERGNESRAKLLLETPKGSKKIKETVFMSDSALDLKHEKFEKVRVYFSEDIDSKMVMQVVDKVKAFQTLISDSMGFKDFQPIHVLLYKAGDEYDESFRNYQSTFEHNIFTFPVKVKKIEELQNFNMQLDYYIPHTIAFHSTTEYFKEKDKFEWLAIGITDYMAHRYLQMYFPKHQYQPYKIRVKQVKDVTKGKLPRTADVLKDKPTQVDYLIGSAFIKMIADKKGPGILNTFFGELENIPRNKRDIDIVIKQLETVVGEDFQQLLNEYPVDKAMEQVKSK